MYSHIVHYIFNIHIYVDSYISLHIIGSNHCLSIGIRICCISVGPIWDHWKFFHGMISMDDPKSIWEIQIIKIQPIKSEMLELDIGGIGFAKLSNGFSSFSPGYPLLS